VCLREGEGAVAKKEEEKAKRNELQTTKVKERNQQVLIIAFVVGKGEGWER
jgi:hypothetical protein